MHYLVPNFCEQNLFMEYAGFFCFYKKILTYANKKIKIRKIKTSNG